MSSKQLSDGSIGTARYTHNHNATVFDAHSRRGAADSVAHLPAHLRAGMDLLDVSCGPTSVTAGLAKRVVPGRIAALDATVGALEAVRTTLNERGLSEQVELASGDVMTLPFEDVSFDVVHAHQVLQHFTDPVGALVEVCHLTRPGGIVAVRDAIHSAMTWLLEPAGMEQWCSVYMAITRANGGKPGVGNRLLSWAREAGFTDAIASTSAWCYATPTDRDWRSQTWTQRCLTSFGPRVVGLGLTDGSNSGTVARTWRQWGASEDAWFVVVHNKVLARI